MSGNGKQACDHVGEEFLGPPFETCPICSSSTTRRRVARVQRDPDVWFCECPDCGAASADRFPVGTFLKGLYEPSHYVPLVASDDLLSRRCAKRILRFAQPAPTKPSDTLSIVDYGGADGNLARELRLLLQQGGELREIEITVVDLHARETGEGIRFVTPDAFVRDSSRYDLLLASAVIEHLPDLRGAVRDLLDHAAPGAIFYGRTPYDLPLHRLYSGHRLQWPRHLHDLGPRFWEGFLARFEAEGEIVHSGPSIAQTSLRAAPLATIAAQLLKAPSLLETRWIRPAIGYRGFAWHWVGGWEAVLRLG